MRLKTIAGNWKMNTDQLEAVALSDALKKGISEFSGHVNIIIAPPFPFIKAVKDAVKGSSIKIAAQNCSSEDKGAFTGEVSAVMLKSIGTEYIIIGHSERRAYFNETGDILRKKLEQCLKNDLHPIFCVGEILEERQAGNHFDVVENQLEEGLGKFGSGEAEKFLVAYEPVWAIGTGQTANVEQITEMHGFIRSFLKKKFGEKVSENISILYGGSCNEKNAAEIFACKDVDGGLIGGASLKADSFMEIINLAK